MKQTFQRLSRTALAVIGLSLVMASCQKGSDVAQLKPQNSQAAVSSVSSVTIYGNYGNPALGASGFGTRYVNIITGAQDATGAVAENLLFKGINNGTVSAASGYTFKYLATTAALSAITVDDYDDATTVTTSFGRNTNTSGAPNGWWNYNHITHKATPVSNVVMFIETPAGDVYAFKSTSIDGEGSPVNNRGVYHFDIGLVE